MTDQLWRLWNIVNGKETPLTTPVPFAEARMTMRLKAIGDFSRRLGWKLRSQGNDFMIWRMPGGADNELRIRMETPEVNNYEAIAGIEHIEARDPVYQYTDDDFDYTVTADMPTPTDGLFAFRDGKDTQEIEVSNV